MAVLLMCIQGTVDSDSVGFDLVSGSTDVGCASGSLVFVKYIQPDSTAYGKLRYHAYCIKYYIKYYLLNC